MTMSTDDELVDGAPAESTEAAVRSETKNSFWRRLRSNRTAMVAVAFLVLVIVSGLLAPWLTPYDPSVPDVANRYGPPSWAHPLGTDGLGRDFLTRLLYASRISLTAAALAVGVAFVLGVPFGLVAGYFRGRIDAVTSRVADVLMSLPTLVLAIAIIAALGPGLTNAMFALGVVYSPRVFRLVRGATLAVREETYVEAAVSIGLPANTIIRRHVLVNILPPLTIQLSLMTASAILAEASLSFLGLGVLPPDASWGVLLGDAFRSIRVAPLLIYWPGLVIALTTLAFNVLGDGISDAFGRESRARKRRAKDVEPVKDVEEATS
ncbi:ABC transporter permease [Geodermatophilus sp. URMC 63]